MKRNIYYIRKRGISNMKHVITTPPMEDTLKSFIICLPKEDDMIKFPYLGPLSSPFISVPFTLSLMHLSHYIYKIPIDVAPNSEMPHKLQSSMTYNLNYLDSS
jgi:hypothetical protein